MIQSPPKLRLHPVGKCPECGGDVYEEAHETGDYHPDHEMIYYNIVEECRDCGWYKHQE
jgi:hypothetical protein